MLTDDEKRRFVRATGFYPEEDRLLLLLVHKASNRAKGMANAKAVCIITCCLEGQPKIGWQDDAREVLASVR